MFDRQTKTFVAAVANCLPELSEEVMQGWIENPASLHRVLEGVLCPAGRVSTPAHLWREENGVIYFSVTSDGTTGGQWIARLEKRGYRLSDYAKRMLRSPDFKPTKGVTTEIAVLKGMLFADNDRLT